MKQHTIKIYGTEVKVFTYKGSIIDQGILKNTKSADVKIEKLVLHFPNGNQELECIFTPVTEVKVKNRVRENLLGIGFKMKNKVAIESYQVVAENIDRKEMANILLNLGATHGYLAPDGFLSVEEQIIEDVVQVINKSESTDENSVQKTNTEDTIKAVDTEEAKVEKPKKKQTRKKTVEKKEEA